MIAEKEITTVVVKDGNDDVIVVGGVPAFRITKDGAEPSKAKAVKVEIGASHPHIAMGPDNRMKVE